MTRMIIAAVLMTAGTASGALAQSSPIELRVGKLEKEMRAVQRSVFPQGAPVQPELSASAATPSITGAPASSPISDLTTRVDTLERQLATLTGASEQSSFKIRQLEDALAKVQARLTAIEGTTPANAAATPGLGSPAPATIAATGDTTRIVAPTRATQTRPSGTTSNVAAAADPTRRAALAAIEMPATGDAVEDAYTYGFRLYTAKLFPEAQANLKNFTAKQPVTQRRWSYAQNLLGRAYLDEGKPALASVAFFDNYQKAPRGERAADSLTWLGQSLIKLKKTTDACKVFAELEEVYGARLTADQKARAAKGRVDAKCAA